MTAVSSGGRAAYEAFVARWPSYLGTAAIDDLRAREFSRLEETGQVYLDYTGSSLYPESLVREHADRLAGIVLGNPHSGSPTSRASTELVEACRARALEFFRADPAEYALAFTANASHALKLVGEAYPFGVGSRFLLTFDNHNSVNGIREFDRAHGAETVYLSMLPPDLRVDEQALVAQLDSPSAGPHRLFAFPAQSNFSGVQHPLEWIGLARSRGWDVLLDAAAFVPTNQLDLSVVKPDYVVLSFYKMFGYPTGVGALIARHEALAKLRRPWFAGGTINVASVQADRFVLAAGARAFEDGTQDFANIPAVHAGLDLIERIGYPTIHERVRTLTAWLLEQLLAKRHANGTSFVRLYGPTTMDRRGATVTFNFVDASGRPVDHSEIESRASAHGISLRTGCFCNPGAGELALGLSRGLLDACFGGRDERLSYDDLRRCIDPHAAGAVRVSLGLVSNANDVITFVEWVDTLLGAM